MGLPLTPRRLRACLIRAIPYDKPMQSPLLWIGALVFCLGTVLAGAHQELKGPSGGYWLDYGALAVIAIGGCVFVAGGMLSATG